MKAVLFDMDGTLVDTERVGNQVLIEAVARLGLIISLEEAIVQFAGRKMADTLNHIERRLGASLPADFLEMLRTDMARAFERELRPMEGVPTLLDALRGAGYPLCVASNGPCEKMTVSLGVTGLLPFFEGRIYSAYDCDAFKPDPGLFLYAAEQMGVHSEDCVVVEDSMHGVEGARRAGMRVFGYVPNGRGFDLGALGAEVFHHMTELIPFFCPRGESPQLFEDTRS